MSLSKSILGAAEKLRPVITKIIPAKTLSAMKAKVINHAGLSAGEHPYETFEAERFKKGINLSANIKAYTGLGEASRILAKQIDSAGIDMDIHEFFVPPCNVRFDESFNDRLVDDTKDLQYGINIFHVNASEFPIAFLNMGKELWDYHYNIAYWAWELEEFPVEWCGSFNLVDEVWTLSDFTSNTLKKYTDKPIYTVPLSVEAPTEDGVGRSYFNLPNDKFLFLMMFDSGSVMERKNPLAVIESFKKAFPADSEISSKVGLVIKINEPELSEKDEKIIKDAFGTEYENIYFVCGSLSKKKVNSLIQSVDVLVSLHRGEGFGLVMAEAMYLGTPVIATDYSANTEYMDSDVACMVDYRLIELDKDYVPFKKGFHWADADTDSAAAYMKRLYEDKDFYQKLSRKAESRVREKLSYENTARIISDRVNDIYSMQ